MDMYQVTAGVEVDDDGCRAVCRVPLPVPPPVVFDAVATGEGITSWFVPCALEPQVGGRIVQFADPGAPDPTPGPEAAAEAMLTATVGEITDPLIGPADALDAVASRPETACTDVHDPNRSQAVSETAGALVFSHLV